MQSIIKVEENNEKSRSDLIISTNKRIQKVNIETKEYYLHKEISLENKAKEQLIQEIKKNLDVETIDFEKIKEISNSLPSSNSMPSEKILKIKEDIFNLEYFIDESVYNDYLRSNIYYRPFGTDPMDLNYTDTDLDSELMGSVNKVLEPYNDVRSHHKTDIFILNKKTIDGKNLLTIIWENLILEVTSTNETKVLLVIPDFYVMFFPEMLDKIISCIHDMKYDFRIKLLSASKYEKKNYQGVEFTIKMIKYITFGSLSALKFLFKQVNKSPVSYGSLIVISKVVKGGSEDTLVPLSLMEIAIKVAVKLEHNVGTEYIYTSRRVDYSNFMIPMIKWLAQFPFYYYAPYPENLFLTEGKGQYIRYINQVICPIVDPK
jgi:hypothetical protein